MMGLRPPYVLMPYSASGIHAEYYCSKYPDEIEGLILLDATPSVEAVAREWGWTSDEIIEARVELESYIPPTEEEIEAAIERDLDDYIQLGYTKEELTEIYNTPNCRRTILAQELQAPDNMREVMALEIPKAIPILAICSALAEIEDDSLRTEWFNRHKEHMSRLGAERIKSVTIKGSKHGNISCHPDYLKIICKEVDAFLIK